MSKNTYCYISSICIHVLDEMKEASSSLVSSKFSSIHQAAAWLFSSTLSSFEVGTCAWSTTFFLSPIFLTIAFANLWPFTLSSFNASSSTVAKLDGSAVYIEL